MNDIGVNMSDKVEFPQADPAIRYIAERVSKIEDQFVCNAGYHRDHLAVKTRLDKLDAVMAEMNQIVAQLDVSNINRMQALINEKSDEFLKEAIKQNALIMKKSDGYLREAKKQNAMILDELTASPSAVINIASKAEKTISDTASKAEKTMSDAASGYYDNQRKLELITELLATKIEEKSKLAVNRAFDDLVNKQVAIKTKGAVVLFMVALVIGYIMGYGSV